jgi:hypothetical protein
MPFIDPEDVPRAYKCMNVFVAPYTRPATETFALANLEALAMGVPFVHFGTGGIRVRVFACVLQSPLAKFVNSHLTHPPTMPRWGHVWCAQAAEGPRFWTRVCAVPVWEASACLFTLHNVCSAAIPLALLSLPGSRGRNTRTTW